MKAVIILLVMLVSSCSTVDKLWDGTTFTYNAKKKAFGGKTKVNKHFNIKF